MTKHCDCLKFRSVQFTLLKQTASETFVISEWNSELTFGLCVFLCIFFHSCKYFLLCPDGASLHVFSLCHSVQQQLFRFCSSSLFRDVLCHTISTNSNILVYPISHSSHSSSGALFVTTMSDYKVVSSYIGTTQNTANQMNTLGTLKHGNLQKWWHWNMSMHLTLVSHTAGFLKGFLSRNKYFRKYYLETNICALLQAHKHWYATMNVFHCFSYSQVSTICLVRKQCCTHTPWYNEQHNKQKGTGTCHWHNNDTKTCPCIWLTFYILPCGFHERE